jgi:hypothetical protein
METRSIKPAIMAGFAQILTGGRPKRGCGGKEPNMDENGQISQEFPAAAQKMGFAKRLVGVFLWPIQLMRSISKYPSALPMLIVGVALSLANIPFLPQMTEITTREMSAVSIQRYGVDVYGAAQAAASAADPGAVGVVAATASAVSAVSLAFGYLVGALIPALALFLITKIMGGRAGFKQYFSMTCHIGIISSLSGILISYIAVGRGSSTNITSLAAVLMPDGNIGMLSFNILAAITLPGVWAAVLYVLGVKEMNDGFSYGKAAVAPAILFVLSVAVTAAATSFSTFSLDLLYNSGMF